MLQTICGNTIHKLLSSVKHPSRYIGHEHGSFVKPAGDLVRICYAFPDVYEVGMSYLGFQILYALTKSLPYADCERVYAPWPDMEAAMRESGTPIWSLESKSALTAFDVIGFTLQYELSYTNILTILSLSGIPFRAENRDDTMPLVIAGGIGALTPAPVSPFFDAFLLGDGEVLIPEVLSVLKEYKGAKRCDKLAALGKIEGVYVPLIHTNGERIHRRIAENLDNSFIYNSMIVPNTGIVHDRAAIQVFKGCTRGCRFCQAGMIDRPVRERSAASVCDQMQNLLESTGWDEAGLLSLASCDWTGLQGFIGDMSDYFTRNNIKLSLPSLRVDAFSVDLAARLETMRKGGLTFAPEAGTQRLRNVINKGVTDDDITEALEKTFEHGWDRVKLYFMMGLPTETNDDLNGIIEICNRAVYIARKYKRRGEISASVAGFVPKAHTPFQWEAQASMEELHERGRYIKSSIKSKKVSVAYHEPKQTFLEGVFARGDARLAAAVELAWIQGERFDGWTEYFNFDRWCDVFQQLEIDAKAFTGARDLDDALPWDNIDCGVNKKFLLSERSKAYSGALTPDCRNGECSGCGWNEYCRNFKCAQQGEAQ